MLERKDSTATIATFIPGSYKYHEVRQYCIYAQQELQFPDRDAGADRGRLYSQFRRCPDGISGSALVKQPPRLEPELFRVWSA